MTQPLLEVKNISVEFKTRRGALKAVDDLSIDDRVETLLIEIINHHIVRTRGPREEE